MTNFYNHTVFLLFIGGLFSLILTVAIIFLKKIHRRAIERNRLEVEKKIKPEEVGDIDAKLDDSVDFKRPDVFQELTIWGIQPLLIISFVSLFSQSSEIEIIGAFSLIILTLFHEFYLADRFSKGKGYQFIILLIWIFFFCMISYKANVKKADPSQTTTQQNNTTPHH